MRPRGRRFLRQQRAFRRSLRLTRVAGINGCPLQATHQTSLSLLCFGHPLYVM
ncbi:Uncharacterised protein [Vibrio cholerae]|nr:Uncharacterised protein [Vibrio cholerae]